jgi:ATP-dependent helicase/nuclease subunit A
VPLTNSQLAAVQARGNVLVVAGAGTGKTRTLVERCLSLILDEASPVNVDEILMVTFTDAAAAEMRKRIRTGLEERCTGAGRQRCTEQLALLETAHIGTLHGFCLKLVREHFYELELDPQLAVMREEESSLLAAEILGRLLRELYAAKGDLAGRVRELIRMQGGTSDDSTRKAITEVHGYMRTLADPAAWLNGQISILSESDPHRWREWLASSLPVWSEDWRTFLEEKAEDNEVARDCRMILGKIAAALNEQEFACVLAELEDAFKNCRKGKATAWLEPLKKFREEVAFLLSLQSSTSPNDGGKLSPLHVDWQWTRGPLLALLEVTAEFARRYAAEKRELAAVDFHDLEQHALQLLWNFAEDRPTAIAAEWRARLKYVFVDEYQDINHAQDKIIQALSREGSHANRFLVGDVKQSIYRFRLANPGIFRNYMQTWNSGVQNTISLAENFRSLQALVDFTNSLFRRIMPAEIGGIDYHAQALQFGAPKARLHLGVCPGDPPAAELHLRIKPRSDAAVDTGSTGISVGEIQEAEKEALIVGSRLLELHKAGSPVWDEDAGAFRPVRWADMAILLRAPSRKAESYAKAFGRLGIPLQVAKRGFYNSVEISDLLSLLQVLDNPLQDVPLIAVLLSPFANLSLEEVAGIRLAAKRVRFWTALVTWHRAAKGRAEEANETRNKVTAFLERLARWRSLARQACLSRCLETILAETCYCEWLQVQSRGQQRHANVERFIALAREFDQFQKRGLLRFLSFVEAQKDSRAEPEVAAAGDSDAVRLMSIHQSKGLEFPVVAVADLAKSFNAMDLKSDILLNETYGLCSVVRPPHSRRKYPSLPLWLARRAEHRELLGEELRLLYVAVTRARDRLILSASISERDLEKFGPAGPAAGRGPLLRARSCADWLACWTSGNCPIGESDGAGEHLSWRIYSAPEQQPLPSPSSIVPSPCPAPATPSHTDDAPLVALNLALDRLKWKYPHMAATSEPAKTSVSLLRRRFADSPGVPLSHRAGRPEKTTSITAADRGNAHHSFLQHMTLESPADMKVLQDEVTRLLKAKVLTPQEARALDLEGIAAFWESTTGRAMLNQRDKVHRELAFTARFGVSELVAHVSADVPPDLDNEFVVIQGVADLAAILPTEIWIVDFKSDQVDEDEIEARTKLYTPQLKIYSAALSRIYQRPATRAELYFIAARASVSVTPPMAAAS